jgi:hypothetical protein
MRTQAPYMKDHGPGDRKTLSWQHRAVQHEEGDANVRWTLRLGTRRARLGARDDWGWKYYAKSVRRGPLSALHATIYTSR